MKSKIFTILTLAAAAVLGLSSCSDSYEPKMEREGQVSLKSIGVEISSEMETVSRAEHDLSQFIVSIYDAETQELVRQWTYSAMPELFSLSVGKYRVEIESHAIEKAEWDRPYYFGSKDFEILDSQITEIGKVTCKFASLRVSVVFTDDLREAMADDVTVTVVANDNGRLVYLPSETRSGYFAVVDGSFTLAATFTGTVKGYKENIHKVYEDVKAGQHRIITFSLKANGATAPDETGKVDPSEGINVDVNIEDVDINGNVNTGGEDAEHPERPGGENFGNGGGDDKPDVPVDPTPADDAITFTSALRFGTPMSCDEPDGVVVIKASEGIAHFVLGISTTSSDDDFKAILGNLNGVDIAYPGAVAADLTDLNLANGAEVLDQKEVRFDITSFIGLLPNFPGTHTFRLTVTDNAGNTASREIIFVAK